MSEEPKQEPTPPKDAYVGPETPPDEDDKSGRTLMPDEDPEEDQVQR